MMCVRYAIIQRVVYGADVGGFLMLNTPLTSAALAALLTRISNATTAKVVTDIICVGLSCGLTKYFVFRRGEKACTSSERILSRNEGR